MAEVPGTPMQDFLLVEPDDLFHAVERRFEGDLSHLTVINTLGELFIEHGRAGIKQLEAQAFRGGLPPRRSMQTLYGIYTGMGYGEEFAENHTAIGIGAAMRVAADAMRSGFCDIDYLERLYNNGIDGTNLPIWSRPTIGGVRIGRVAFLADEPILNETLGLSALWPEAKQDPTLLTIFGRMLHTPGIQEYFIDTGIFMDRQVLGKILTEFIERSKLLIKQVTTSPQYIEREQQRAQLNEQDLRAIDDLLIMLGAGNISPEELETIKARRRAERQRFIRRIDALLGEEDE